ncbi:LysR family transcriptional regulator [Paenibacillus periandrae]|uniref:LysR family transcriptional regulator n=1 Tax=Paenibacillus periandrae TaxID=1761741 RepID=UPI0023DD7568|nr:LysR family transcriptional regulator [Paenibacillus periandrae]
MDLQPIKTFQTIVKHGSFIRAAEELQYVQSTITMQIQKLESDMGIRLFERGKVTRLTEAGQLFLEKSASILDDYEYLRIMMEDWHQGLAGLIRLGAVEPVASYRLPKLLVPFQDRYPDVQVSIQVGPTGLLSDMLAVGQLDIVICTTPEPSPEARFEALYAEQLTLLLPESHRLANKQELLLKDLQGERLLLPNKTCSYRNRIESSLLENNVHPYYVMEISSMSALKFYVQEQFGIAVVPSLTVDPVPKGTVIKPMKDLNSGLTTGLLTKPETKILGKAGINLITALKEGLSA